MDAMGTLTIVSLVASTLGAILAIVAITLSLVLFLASHRTSLSILTFLGDIKSSAMKTESSQDATIRRLVDAFTDKSARKTVEEERNVLAEVKQIIESEGDFASEAARKRLENKISAALSSSFSALTYQLTEIPHREAALPARGNAPGDDMQVPPGFYRVARWMLQNEAKYQFFGVKFLRDTIFKTDPASQAALQDAIEREMVLLYSVDNPEKPEWKTTACRLNLKHPITRKVLTSLKLESS